MAADIRTPLAPGDRRVRGRGEDWVLSIRTTYTDCESVRLRGCGPANRGVCVTLLLPFDRLEPVNSSSRVRIVSRRQWLRHVGHAFCVAQPFGGLGTAASAGIRLMPFQLEPALALLRHGRLRVLIADEVGLGKTIQAGVMLGQLSADIDAFRALVVTPAGVREQWQHELATRFALETTVSDADWLARRTRELPPDVNPWSLPGIYIASFDLVKRPEVLRALEAVTWDMAIVDEAHGAGPGTARRTAAHAIACSARRVVLLTATPPDGDPARFSALAGLGRLAPSDAISVFRRTRTDAGVPAPRKSIFLAVRLSSLECQMHRLLESYTALVWAEAGARLDARARLAAVVLRKRALSSAGSLALSVRRRLALLGPSPPPEPQQFLLPLHDEDPLDDTLPDDVLAASGLSDAAVERGWLEEIAAVSERASGVESKLALLRRLLVRTSEPMIVFTEYRDTLAQIAAAVAPLRSAVMLHGGMTPSERAGVQRAFNQSGSLLLATDAAAEGLNLHERCRIVVHFELPWTPARLEQRTGRVDRLGQSRTVHEILLVARDTCERLVLAPLVRRARTAAARSGQASRVTVLTESAVAGAVMEGLSPGLEAPPCAPDSEPMDFSTEAAKEAARLATSRRLGGVAGKGARRLAPGDIAVTLGQRASGSAVMVVRVTLERGDGGPVHSELVPVFLDLGGQRLPRAAAALRVITRRIIQTHGQRALEVVAAHSRERLAEVTAIHHRTATAVARRERELAGAARFAAQRLVQIGLFDSRQADALASRREAVSFALQQAEERVAALAPDAALRTSMRIVAVRFGADPQP
ncbi:hypothetical protein BH24ACI5_BH24ACI5_04180 [soil metagenome]